MNRESGLLCHGMVSNGVCQNNGSNGDSSTALWEHGKRVKKSNGKLYWYSLGLDPLAESDLSGNLTEEYIFFGGKRIARRTVSSGAVNYYFADHLGSSRIVTNSTGTILDDSDFYPFGGERVVLASSGNNYKFTGKERDTESGLDFFVARYYSSAYGRFLSPDEFTGGPVDAFSSGGARHHELQELLRRNCHKS